MEMSVQIAFGMKTIGVVVVRDLLQQTLRKKSKTNAMNRGKHKYKSRHGRISYIQRWVLKGNAETEQLYSAIENWRDASRWATQSRTQHASCQTEIKMLRSTLSQVLDVLHQIAPNIQLPNMPPSSSSSAANLCDDDSTDSET